MSENNGEKELVLGTKQLLTIFFVAMLLCGVFFAMGYVVGGNSAKSLSAAATAAATDSSPAPVTEGKREEPSAPATIADPAGAVPASVDPGGSLPAAEPKVSDNPVAAGAQPPPVNAQSYTTPVPAEVTRTPPAASTQAPAATGIVVSEMAKGASYLQVTAVGRPSADELVKMLRKKDFPVILAESSKSTLFRVLVGPYRSTLSLRDAKERLKSLGFDNLIVNKQ
jgi:hypothetical protein